MVSVRGEALSIDSMRLIVGREHPHHQIGPCTPCAFVRWCFVCAGQHAATSGCRLGFRQPGDRQALRVHLLRLEQGAPERGAVGCADARFASQLCELADQFRTDAVRGSVHPWTHAGEDDPKVCSPQPRHLTGCGQLGHDCVGGGDDADAPADRFGGLTELSKYLKISAALT